MLPGYLRRDLGNLESRKALDAGVGVGGACTVGSHGCVQASLGILVLSHVPWDSPYCSECLLWLVRRKDTKVWRDKHKFLKERAGLRVGTGTVGSGRDEQMGCTWIPQPEAKPAGMSEVQGLEKAQGSCGVGGQEGWPGSDHIGLRVLPLGL